MEVSPNTLVEGFVEVEKDQDATFVYVFQVRLHELNEHRGFADERARDEAYLVVTYKLSNDVKHPFRKNASKDFVISMEECDGSVVTEV